MLAVEWKLPVPLWLQPQVQEKEDQIAFYFVDVQAGYRTRRAVLASVQVPIFALGLEGGGSDCFLLYGRKGWI